MSIQIRDIIGTTGQDVTAGSAGNIFKSAAEAVRNLKTNLLLESLVPGQTLSGQVKQMQGSQILLQIAGGTELTARLDKQLDIPIGKMMTFEVKSNMDGKLSLTPLYTNMGGNTSVASASLRAAEIPVTEQSTAMVMKMMQEGMPVDRESLWAMNQLVSKFPDFPSANVVTLNAMGMEVNEENLLQLSAYQNRNHEVLGMVQDIAAGLEELLQENAPAQTTILQTDDGIVSVPQLPEQIVEQGQVAEPGQEEVLPQLGDKNLPTQPSAENVNALTENRPDAEAVAKQVELEKNLLSSLDPKSALKVLEGLKELGTDLTDYKAFSTLFKQELENSWLMKPESFANKEEVKDFYQKMQRELTGMREVLESAGKIDTSMGRAVTGLQQNLDFMQNINQIFPYLQIPMKAGMDNAHGDLYVYKNKGKAREEDGSVSALLHLDMDALGPMDVYVKLREQNVSTQFYLQDDETIDFIAAHIDQLNARLQKKGYFLEAKMKYLEEKEDTTDVIKNIRGEDGEHRLAFYNSFDMRA